MRWNWLWAMTVLAIASLTTQQADAGPLNDLGRYLGWGWSNGYHARYGWASYPAAYCNGCESVPAATIAPADATPLQGGPVQGGPTAYTVPMHGGMPVYWHSAAQQQYAVPWGQPMPVIPGRR